VGVDPEIGVLAGRLRRSAEGYLAYGQRYWPGADHFLLLTIDSAACLIGDAKTVCRACVMEAARAMLARLDDLATGSCRPRLPYLDLLGDSDSAAGPCTLCGDAN
jgi:hypothetical protein